ncbi:ABC transporter permease subunit [Pelagibius sp.]|uniref:ABC transporter permease subunit n=1 Tax=Pelagibius sp. TaxID=1931238 RepID=UPI00261EF9AB|nr:ABC transporter permease subunit [Pelagibius sp.]
MKTILKNSRTRNRFIQGTVLVVTLGILLTFVLTTRHNLLEQGIATGFGFLERSTGWPINFSLFEVTANSPYADILLAGLLNTLLVGVLGISLATVIGVIVGLMRISDNFVLNLVGTTFVEVFRNVPLILQVFVWYAVLTHLPSPRQAISVFDVGYISNRGLIVPSLDMSALDIILFFIGLGLAGYAIAAAGKTNETLKRHAWSAFGAVCIVLFLILLFSGRSADAPLVNIPELRGLRFVGGIAIKPEFTALLFSIAVFGGAYVGEIVRGGFLSVDKGKIEAARGLGMTAFMVNRFVRIPLAVRAILPALTNQFIWLMKATTLGIAIGYPDYFMIVSTSINQSGQTIELIALLMAGFLLINYVLGFTMNWINKRLALKGQAS